MSQSPSEALASHVRVAEPATDLADTLDHSTDAADVSVSDDDDVALAVQFTAPLLGLEHLSQFALVVLHKDSYLFSLQSVEDPGIRLLVLAPGEVFSDYSPEIDNVSRAAVGLRAGEVTLVLVVVHAGESLADSTANLLAPIIVNPQTGDAAQIVLTGTDYPLRAPLTA